MAVFAEHCHELAETRTTNYSLIAEVQTRLSKCLAVRSTKASFATSRIAMQSPIAWLQALIRSNGFWVLRSQSSGSAVASLSADLIMSILITYSRQIRNHRFAAARSNLSCSASLASCLCRFSSIRDCESSVGGMTLGPESPQPISENESRNNGSRTSLIEVTWYLLE